jgi:hypothetical protein
MKEELEKLEQFSQSTRIAMTEQLIQLYATMYANWILKLKKSDPSFLINSEEELWKHFKLEKKL